MQQSNHISKKISTSLKSLRSARKWSLDRASLATGVSKAMLGQIEREESSPTIALLWKIADGFEISFSALLDGPCEEQSPPLRSLSKSNIPTTGEAIRAVTLFPYERDTRCEIFLHELLPKATHCSRAHNPGVIEHIISIDGPMEVLVDGDWLLIEKGQGVRIDASLPHGYRNRSNRVVRFHNIIHYRNLVTPPPP